MGIRVIEAGFFTTVQDGGRRGYLKYAIPESGAADKRAYEICNLLLGNNQEAVLECTFLGPTLEFTKDNIIAITGADMSPSLNGEEISMYMAHPVKKGDILSLKSAKSGVRAYIGFCGGLDIKKVLGSYSTNTSIGLGGLQGRALKPGDFIPFKKPKAKLKNLSSRRLQYPDYFEKNTLRVILGPQDDRFVNADELFNHGYKVITFNRMGYKLEGGHLESKGGYDIISDGIPCGAVQVSGEKNLIIAAMDRQTTGGYAKIGCVISADLPVLSHKKAGDIIRFEKTDIKKTHRILLEEQREMENIKRIIEGKKWWFLK